MKKISALFFIFPILFCTNVLRAQDTVKEQAKDTVIISDTLRHQKVLIIPFEEKMFLSDATKEIATGSKLTFEQVVWRFNANTVVWVRNSLPGFYETKIMFGNPVDSLSDLRFIHANTGYKYEPLKQESKVSPKNMLSAFKKKDEEGKIKKGEIVAPPGETPKYMNTVIKNDTLLRYLHDKYFGDIFIFINQLEIKNDLADYTQVGTNTFIRKLFVHYSIFNSRGHLIWGGIAADTFPSSMNNVDEIIKKCFHNIGAQIVGTLPQPKMVKEERKQLIKVEEK